MLKLKSLQNGSEGLRNIRVSDSESRPQDCSHLMTFLAQMKCHKHCVRGANVLEGDVVEFRFGLTSGGKK